jgi:hypothetical protein
VTGGSAVIVGTQLGDWRQCSECGNAVTILHCYKQVTTDSSLCFSVVCEAQSQVGVPESAISPATVPNPVCSHSCTWQFVVGRRFNNLHSRA